MSHLSHIDITYEIKWPSRHIGWNVFPWPQIVRFPVSITSTAAFIYYWIESYWDHLWTPAVEVNFHQEGLWNLRSNSDVVTEPCQIWVSVYPHKLSAPLSHIQRMQFHARVLTIIEQNRDECSWGYGEKIKCLHWWESKLSWPFCKNSKGVLKNRDTFTSPSYNPILYLCPNKRKTVKWFFF